MKYEASLSCSPITKSYVSNRTDKHLPLDKTGIVDSGATQMYIAPNVPYEIMDTKEKNQSRHSKWTSSKLHRNGRATHPTIEFRLPNKSLHYAYLKKTLIGVGPICDANCTVVFRKEDVTVLSPQGKPIFQG